VCLDGLEPQPFSASSLLSLIIARLRLVLLPSLPHAYVHYTSLIIPSVTFNDAEATYDNWFLNLTNAERDQRARRAAMWMMHVADQPWL